MTEEAAKTLANARKTKSYSCERCGARFTGRLSRSDKNRPRFCSEQCRYATINERRKRERAESRMQETVRPVPVPVAPPAPIRKAPPPPEWKDSDLYATKQASPEVLAAIARSAQDMREGKHKPFDGTRRAAADIATPPQPQEAPDA